MAPCCSRAFQASTAPPLPGAAAAAARAARLPAGAGSWHRRPLSRCSSSAVSGRAQLLQPRATNDRRELWVQTSNQAVLTAAVEAGHPRALLKSSDAALAEAWSKVVRFSPVFQEPQGQLLDEQGSKLGHVAVVSSKEDLKAAEAAAKGSGYVVMDATDWKVIPAENLVAAFQSGEAKLLGVAGSAADARVMLEALELGTAGVVLRTEDPLEVKKLAAYIQSRSSEGAATLTYESATVTRVTPVGMGDRVCVDLCSMMEPGEGLLVGSFSRSLFLVHSECLESGYINSRPFRCNAGAVHAYLQAPGGRTAYLSELSSGSEVLVVDAAGRSRTAIVGRIKLEARPLMLVEAQTADGQLHSTLLQNAETVRLVGPAAGSSGAGGAASGGSASNVGSSSSSSSSAVGKSSSSSSSIGTLRRNQQQQAWEAISVSTLAPGDKVYVLRQEGARHTGISIQERIVER